VEGSPARRPRCSTFHCVWEFAEKNTARTDQGPGSKIEPGAPCSVGTPAGYANLSISLKRSEIKPLLALGPSFSREFRPFYENFVSDVLCWNSRIRT
jgi:hypothetical protein